MKMPNMRWFGVAVGVALALVAGGCSKKSEEPAAVVKKEEPKIVVEQYEVPLPAGVKMVMVKIPAGKFTMMWGTEDAHEVELTQDFWVGRSPVTLAQIWAVLGGPRHWEHDNIPNDFACCTSDFTEKLNNAGLAPQGWKFAFLTEAQWEYACFVNEHKYGIETSTDEEECADYYARSFEGDAIDPTGPEDGLYKVTRRGLQRSHYFRGHSKIVNRVALVRKRGHDDAVIRGVMTEIKETKAHAKMEQREFVLPDGVKLEMVKIPAGSFMMGSPADEGGRGDDEKLHKVTLTQDFYLGKYEVTQAQYQAIMGEKAKKGPNYPKFQRIPDWNKANDFCKKLNEKGLAPEGWRFDLPTEAQWEYACRAGATTGHCRGWGFQNAEDWDKTDGVFCGVFSDVAWYGENEKKNPSVHPVGKKAPNAWGLYDMVGNVWEWCRDSYGPYSGDATDPTGPTNGNDKVLRGGSVISSGRNCRAACRKTEYSKGEEFSDVVGFRVALVRVK